MAPRYFKGTIGTSSGPRVGRRADDVVVHPLFDDMCTPPGGPCNDEERREHLSRHAHHGVGDGAKPVEVGKHLLSFRNRSLDTPSDLEHFHRPGTCAEPAGNFFDHLVAGVGNRVDRMTQADADLLGRHPLSDVCPGFAGTAVALLDFEGRFVRSTMLWSTQGTDCAGHG
jgi:hypothetical protein